MTRNEVIKMTQFEMNEQRRNSKNFYCVKINGEATWIYTDENEAQKVVAMYRVKFPNCVFTIETKW